MEPYIQYVKASDGVNIACYALGNGPPILLSRLPGSHLQSEWHSPATRAQYEMIAGAATLLRLDPRGWGMSDRDVADISLDAYVSDLHAVIERLTDGPVRVVATDSFDSAIAVAHAANHPEQVSHLVVTNATVRATEGFREFQEQFDAVLELGRTDWEFASQSAMRLAMGWDDNEAARDASAIFRDAVTPEFFIRFAGEYLTWDLTHLLPRVKAPVLFIHTTGDVTISHDSTRDFAALLPEVRVVVNDGRTSAERIRQREALVAEFLFGIRLPTVPRTATSTAVILFMDVADSTALTEQLGDIGFRDRARLLDTVLRGVIRDHAGTPVEGKLLGDGVLAVFASARDAIRAALRCAGAGAQAGLPLHLGIHAGDVIREADNVYGGAVNIAARITALAEPGEVLVSGTVRGLARTSSNVTFEDRGERALKGVPEPQHLFAVDRRL